MAYLTLKKPPNDILDDVSGYTVKVTDDDTNIKDSLFLINVVLSSKSETSLKATRKSITDLQDHITVLEDTSLSIDIVMPTLVSSSQFNVTKKYNEIVGTTDHYSIDAKKGETGGKTSMMMVDVAISPASEMDVNNIRKQIATLQGQIDTLETTLLEIDIILPVILQKVDFTKEEVSNGV